jgi:hypothetical protein
MKTFLFMSAALLSIAGISTHADAQNYPWCAYLSVKGGATNCGFTTFDQCMSYLGGMGGFCMRNTQYIPPPGPRPRYQPQHRRYIHRRPPAY